MLPLMPRWRTKPLSCPQKHTIYFPRRKIFETVWPLSVFAKERGIFLRKSKRFTSIFLIVFPVRHGLRLRMTVSTSGNSGMVLAYRILKKRKSRLASKPALSCVWGFINDILHSGQEARIMNNICTFMPYLYQGIWQRQEKNIKKV